ncbi:Bromodomain family protein [Candida albicans]|uniref:Bromodomain family protein n=1 Tax=Candida albicans TaxID=5476 RepID=A0A8H6F0M1_CANAX|nr:Bromodomain family protein [Candida albicans]
MSEQVKINPDLSIILVGSVINKCISEYKGDYKDCKALFPVNKFILDLNNLTQEYTTKFPNIDIHFPQIDIKLLSFIITKTLYHKFVTVTQDHVIIDVLPHAYENYLKNIVATSTLRYAKYLLKSAKDLYELEQKKLRKEKGGVSLQGNAPKETIPTLQQQSATPNEKQEVVVPPQNKVDTIKESKPISNVPEPTKVQPKPQNSDNKDSTVSEKPSPNESTSLLVTKEKSEEKVVDEDQTMESSEDQKNEEQDLEESKELSNTDTDKMDIDEPQKPIDDKTSEKVEEEINQDQDQEMSDEGEEEKKQTDEEAEKPIESIEENDEKNKESVIIEEDKEEEISKTKETEQDESDEKVEETGKTEEETNKEEDAHQPSSPEEESPSIEEIPLKHESDADIEAIPGSDSSKEATPEVKQTSIFSPFLQPVSVKDAPDYYNVVREPRDLKNIMKAVKSKNEPPLYQSVKELERDIMLMFANCIMYNQSGDDLVELTKTMKQDISEVFKMFEEAEEDIK